MPSKSPLEKERLKQALIVLSINIELWQALTPEERKERYHTKIMRVITENHSTKTNMEKDSSEFIKHEENISLLNSLYYENDEQAEDAINQSDCQSQLLISDEGGVFAILLGNTALAISSNFDLAMHYKAPQTIKEAFDKMIFSNNMPKFSNSFWNNPQSKHFLVRQKLIMKNLGCFLEEKFQQLSNSSILLLCKSLSLDLPYNIIDPMFDQDLIHMLLTDYVKKKDFLPQQDEIPHAQLNS